MGESKPPAVLLAAALNLTVFVCGPAAAAGTACINWLIVPPTIVGLFYPGNRARCGCATQSTSIERLKTRGFVPLVPRRRGSRPQRLYRFWQEARADARQAEKHLAQGEDRLRRQDCLLRFQWKTMNHFPGETHPHRRFDGRKRNATAARALRVPRPRGGRCLFTRTGCRG